MAIRLKYGFAVTFTVVHVDSGKIQAELNFSLCYVQQKKHHSYITRSGNLKDRQTYKNSIATNAAFRTRQGSVKRNLALQYDWEHTGTDVRRFDALFARAKIRPSKHGKKQDVTLYVTRGKPSPGSICLDNTVSDVLDGSSGSRHQDSYCLRRKGKLKDVICCAAYSATRIIRKSVLREQNQLNGPRMSAMGPRPSFGRWA